MLCEYLVFFQQDAEARQLLQKLPMLINYIDGKVLQLLIYNWS